MKRCGVTKTISPPSIKLEPPEPEPQSMLPDSSSDLRQPGDRRHKGGGHFHSSHRIKTEFEVKQEPSWDGEVSQVSRLYVSSTNLPVESFLLNIIKEYWCDFRA